MTIHVTYFVHGTTTDNETGIATGWNPGQLSEKGIEQAKELSRLTAGKTFDVVFCSDLTRAVQTAQLAFGERFPIVPDIRLREISYGDWNGGSASDFKHRMHEFVFTPFPNGESYKDVEDRMRDFLEYCKKAYGGKSIAIVAHQAPQLALDVILRGKTWITAIDNDWRRTGSWQPGWEYAL
jgi:broad specificity phosphatase PhoE